MFGYHCTICSMIEDDSKYFSIFYKEKQLLWLPLPRIMQPFGNGIFSLRKEFAHRGANSFPEV